MGKTLYYLAHIPQDPELLDAYSSLDAVTQANGFTLNDAVDILTDVMEREKAAGLVHSLVRGSYII